MKKLNIKALTLCAMIMSSPQAFAGKADVAFSNNMDLQRASASHQHFNFHSDKYIQMKASSKYNRQVTFKRQLDEQKSQLKPQKFNPVSDAYYQTH